MIGQDTSVAEFEQQLRDPVPCRTCSDLTIRNKTLENDLKEIRNGRKFGLYWDDEADEAQREARTRLPLLVEQPEHQIGTGDRPHLLIEGDNYHALLALAQTHLGKINAIYVDPPYNKDADVTYNDYRPHSSWLSFMAPRLELAWRLLSDDGVMFISIDDTEFGNLQLLLRQLFPVTGYKGDKKAAGTRDPFVGVFVWKKRTGSSDKQGAYLSADHEYVICYAKPGFSFEGTAKAFANYKHYDAGSDDPWSSDNLTCSKNYLQRPNLFFPIQNPTTGTWYAPNPARVWSFVSRDTLPPGKKVRKELMEDLIARGKVLFPQGDRVATYDTFEALLAAIENGTAPKNLRADMPGLEFWVGRPIGDGTPQYKRHRSELRRTTKPISTWLLSTGEVGDEEVMSLRSELTGAGGKRLQDQVPGVDFPYPKPLSLILGLLRAATVDQPNATILDFFAGSGTTGDAVLQLNEEDDGNRRFILVTNNEVEAKKEAELKKAGFAPGDSEWEAEGICARVTRPRLRAIMADGYRKRDKARTWVEAFGDSLRCFAVVPMVERSESLDDMAEDIRRPGVALLRVTEDCYDLIEQADAYELYGSSERVLGILNDPLAHDDLIAALRRHAGQRQIALYAFSFSGDVDPAPFRQAFGDQVGLRSMPPDMVRAYRDVLDCHVAGTWR